MTGRMTLFRRLRGVFGGRSSSHNSSARTIAGAAAPARPSQLSLGRQSDAAPHHDADTLAMSATVNIPSMSMAGVVRPVPSTWDRLSDPGVGQQQQQEENERQDNHRQQQRQQQQEEEVMPASTAAAGLTQQPMQRPDTPGFPSWASDCGEESLIATTGNDDMTQQPGSTAPVLENPYTINIGPSWQHHGELLEVDSDQTAPTGLLFIGDAPDLLVSYELVRDMAMELPERADSLLVRMARPSTQQLNLAMGMPQDVAVAGSNRSEAYSSRMEESSSSSSSSEGDSIPFADNTSSSYCEDVANDATASTSSTSSISSSQGDIGAEGIGSVLLRSLSSSSLAPLQRSLGTPLPMYWGDRDEVLIKRCRDSSTSTSTSSSKLSRWFKQLVSPSASRCSSRRTSAASSEDVVVWVDTARRGGGKNSRLKAAAKKALDEVVEAWDVSCSKCSRLVRKSWCSAEAQVSQAGRVYRRAFA